MLLYKSLPCLDRMVSELWPPELIADVCRLKLRTAESFKVDRIGSDCCLYYVWYEVGMADVESLKSVVRLA